MDTGCLVLLHGPYQLVALVVDTSIDNAFSSAEAAAGMIVADINGEKWQKPAWFPKHYLTTERV